MWNKKLVLLFWMVISNQVRTGDYLFKCNLPLVTVLPCLGLPWNWSSTIFVWYFQISYESYTCDDFPKPYILKQPETQITLHGHNLTLFCRAASTSPVDMTFTWKVDNDVIDDVGNGSDCVGRCIYHKSHSFDGKGREVTSGKFNSYITNDVTKICIIYPRVLFRILKCNCV